MDLPKPGPEQKSLERLAGEWVGEETLHPSPFDPNGGKATSRVRNVMAVGGFALVQDYAQSRGPGVHFEGHGVFRWDGPAGEYSLAWIDSTGFPPSEFRGKFAGEVLTMVSKNMMGQTRATWTLQGTTGYEYRMDVSPDGQAWAPFLEGTYRRA
jgi:hypothetical protein